MTKPKKRDPLRTEAAIKRAVRLWHAGQLEIKENTLQTPELSRWEVAFISHFSHFRPVETWAIADLRDLYRKRASIRMKVLRKAIQPKRRGK